MTNCYSLGTTASYLLCTGSMAFSIHSQIADSHCIDSLYIRVSHLRPAAVSMVSCVFDSYSTTMVTSLLRGIVPSSGEFIPNYISKPLVFLGVGVGRGPNIELK